MKKSFYIFGIILIVVIALSVFLYFRFTSETKKVHFHAGFQIYKNDVLQDFSAIGYDKVAPCNESESSETKEAIQMDKAHLHNGVGDVIHIEALPSTWGDLFKNLRYPIASGVSIKAYVNSHVIAHPLSVSIHPYDSAVFYIGKHDEKFTPLRHAVSIAHIKEVEKESENCGSGSH